MPTPRSADNAYLGAEVPADVADAFKRRAADLERSATGQLRHLIREFACAEGSTEDDARPAST